MNTLDDIDDEEVDLCESMKTCLKKAMQEAAESKKASDLIVQKAYDNMMEAKKKFDEAKAKPSPLEKLGWTIKPRQRKSKKLLPPSPLRLAPLVEYSSPGTEHMFTKSYDMYMTPAERLRAILAEADEDEEYTEYLRRTEGPLPDLEELD